MISRGGARRNDRSETPGAPRGPALRRSAPGPSVSRAELLADNAADAFPRREHDPSPAEPHDGDPGHEKRAHHGPLHLLAVQIPLLLVLDVAVLTDALH